MGRLGFSKNGYLDFSTKKHTTHNRIISHFHFWFIHLHLVSVFRITENVVNTKSSGDQVNSVRAVSLVSILFRFNLFLIFSNKVLEAAVGKVVYNTTQRYNSTLKVSYNALKIE